jgi:hypothetical protein
MVEVGVMELKPEYKLRDLEPRYYLILGALASTSAEAPDQSWRWLYEQRAQELKGQIDALRDYSE